MESIAKQQQTYFQEGHTKSVAFRRDALKRLKQVFKQHEDQCFAALEADFQKPAFETYETELLMIYQEIDHMLTHMDKWAKPTRLRGSIINFPSKNYVYSQPYGVSLVIGAWNYPLNLTIAPLLGSIAAGNCTIVKPSELAPQTSQLLAELINPEFDNGFLQVVEGDAETTQQLLNQPLDYIFFTGSKRVGKIIMKAAAEQLTPITLELGGKSPAIIDTSAELPLAAKRIAWGKFLNAGQTCVSPDYVYIHKSLEDKFCDLLDNYIQQFYGDSPAESPDFARIINQQHFDRLTALLNQDKVAIGGQHHAEDRYIAPTVMTDVNWEDAVMQEEIFGPILPVITYNDLNEAIRTVRSKAKPLALYLFSTNRKVQEQVISDIPFGGGCINDTVTHLGNLEMPFGGVGQSGFGSYHGKTSFNTFSHQKSVMKKANWLDIPMRYPPYDGKLKWLKRLMQWL